MSMLARVIAALAQPESAQQRAASRREARDAARPGDWLSLVLDHQEAIEHAFGAVLAGADDASRKQDLHRLALLLTGHARAKEAILYPALAAHGGETHAAIGCEEQFLAKVQIGRLERLPPMSEAFDETLHHLETAISGRLHAEERSWFLDLKARASQADQHDLTRRYAEECARHFGGEVAAS